MTSLFWGPKHHEASGSTALVEADIVVVVFLGCCFFLTDQHAVRASGGRGRRSLFILQYRAVIPSVTRIGKHGELGVNFTRVVLFDSSG